MKKDVMVPNVDITLLRRQRDTFLDMLEENPKLSPLERYHLNGTINMMDTMLDIAEGYYVAGEGASLHNAGGVRSIT